MMKPDALCNHGGCTEKPNRRVALRLLRCFATHEHVTGVDHARGIDCDVPFVDVLNDAFFIDHEGGAIAKPLFLVKDAIVLHNSALEITEERKSNLDLLCEFAIGGNTVYTQA